MNNRLSGLSASVRALFILFLLVPTWLSATELQAKVVPGFHYFYLNQEMPFAELQQKSEGIAQQIAQTVALQTSTQYYGAFTYVLENLEQASAANLKTRMGWPVKAAVPGTGPYLSETLPDFKCVTRVFEGDQALLHQAWIKLAEDAIAQGFQPTGQGRTLIKLHSRSYVAAELQLEVK